MGESLLKVDGAVKKGETILKKKFHDIETRGERQRAIKAARKEAKKNLRPKGPISAESLLKTSRRKYIDAKRQKRLSKLDAPKLRKSSEEARVIFAIRNTESNKSDQTKKALSELKLNRPYQAVFLPNTKPVIEKLRLLSPFLVWGYPSLENVRLLVTTRARLRCNEDDSEKKEKDEVKSEVDVEEGAARPERKQITQALSSNVLVEEKFGELGLLSVQDLVHEIFTCGDSFEQVIAEIFPFQLESIRKADGVAAEIRRGYIGEFDKVLKTVL